MCAQIAGLQDLRGEGPPGDIGVFQGTASVVVYQFTFSGVTYNVAQRMGARGWVLVTPPTIGPAAALINAAITYAATLSVSEVVLLGTFTTTATINAASNVSVYGSGAVIDADSALTFNAVTFNNVTNCTWFGVRVRRRGIVGAAVYGVYVTGTTDKTTRIIDCVVTNETTGFAYCHGFATADSSAPIISGCTITGGGGGAYCFGFYTNDSSAPIISGCTITGGGGGAYCFGFYTDDSSASAVSECTVTGGGGGADCFGFYMVDSSAPAVSDCTVTGGGGGTSYTWSYLVANNGRFQPYATKPYILVSVHVYVSAAAAAGTTLSLGNTVGGIEIATGIPIDSTGSKYFAFTRTEQAAAAYLYTTPSAAIADGSLTVYYVVRPNYATCNGANIDTHGYARVTESSILTNGASDALYATDVAEAANAWRVTNCHIETMDPVNQSSIISQSAYANGPIYNCTLIGLVTNIVPAAGTAVGSNIQV